MSDVKKYYWLKLNDNFFSEKEIKKLRKIAGGDTYTIIYLKLQLLSLKTDGKLYFDSIEDTFVDEIALTLDEEVENVKVTLMFLQKVGFIKEVAADEFLLPKTIECIGKESASAERVRKYRENKKMLHGNTNVQMCNTEIEIEKELYIELEKNISISDDILPTSITKEPIPVIKTQYKEIMELFNTICIRLTQIRSIDGKRKKNVNVVWTSQPEISYFKNLFNLVNESDFLCGVNDRAWSCNFDWILKADNRNKIIEGNYKNKKNNTKAKNNIPQLTNYKERDYKHDDFEKYYKNYDEVQA